MAEKKKKKIVKKKKVVTKPIPKTRANSEVKTNKRAMGSGRSYSKEVRATKSTTGIIDGNKAFKYKSGGKIYNYVPGAQNNNPKTGRRI